MIYEVIKPMSEIQTVQPMPSSPPPPPPTRVSAPVAPPPDYSGVLIKEYEMLIAAYERMPGPQIYLKTVIETFKTRVEQIKLGVI